METDATLHRLCLCHFPPTCSSILLVYITPFAMSVGYIGPKIEKEEEIHTCCTKIWRNIHSCLSHININVLFLGITRKNLGRGDWHFQLSIPYNLPSLFHSFGTGTVSDIGDMPKYRQLDSLVLFEFRCILRHGKQFSEQSQNETIKYTVWEVFKNGDPLTRLCHLLPCDWLGWHHLTTHQTAISWGPTLHSELCRYESQRACSHWRLSPPALTWGRMHGEKEESHCKWHKRTQNPQFLNMM